MKKKRKKNTKKENFFIVKYFFVLFFSTLSLLLTGQIIIKNFLFEYDQFKFQEKIRHKERMKRFDSLKEIIEEFCEEKKKIKNINTEEESNEKIVLGKFNDKYIFYNFDSQKNILNRNYFKKKHNLAKFNSKNYLYENLKKGENKIGNELEKLKNIIFEQNDISTKLLDKEKKKIKILKKEIKTIKDCIKKINSNSKLEIPILISNSSFFFY